LNYENKQNYISIFMILLKYYFESLCSPAGLWPALEFLHFGKSWRAACEAQASGLHRPPEA
jgi:hypothetical protein